MEGPSMLYDAQHVKRKLDIALGAQSNDYWTMFSAFVKGLRSKEQFDAFAHSALGNLNLGLHNEFLLTVLQSAESASLADREERAHTETVRAQMLMAPSENVSWLAAFDQDLRPSRPLYELPPSVLDDAALASYRAGDAPLTLSKLKATTVVFAAENGMADVDPVVHDIVGSALTMFLKNVMEEMMVCSGRYFHIHEATEARHSFHPRKKKKGVLTPTHFLMASTLRPSLLGPIFRPFQEEVLLKCDLPVAPAPALMQKLSLQPPSSSSSSSASILKRASKAKGSVTSTGAGTGTNAMKKATPKTKGKKEAHGMTAHQLGGKRGGDNGRTNVTTFASSGKRKAPTSLTHDAEAASRDGRLLETMSQSHQTPIQALKARLTSPALRNLSQSSTLQSSSLPSQCLASTSPTAAVPTSSSSSDPPSLPAQVAPTMSSPSPSPIPHRSEKEKTGTDGEASLNVSSTDHSSRHPLDSEPLQDDADHPAKKAKASL